MKKILLALLIWSVSSTSLAKGGFFQNCRDPITGKLIYSSDCMGLPKKALPSAVNDGRDEIISIRKNLMIHLTLSMQTAIVSICISVMMAPSAHS